MSATAFLTARRLVKPTGAFGRIISDGHACGTGIVNPTMLLTGVGSLVGTQRIQADLPPETVELWLALVAEFPDLVSLGAWGNRSHAARRSDHNWITSSGKRGPRAIDCMTVDKNLHARIVAWATTPAVRVRYGITLVISRRRKWSAKSGWKARPYLGTSGHFDHVHLSNDA